MRIQVYYSSVWTWYFIFRISLPPLQEMHSCHVLNKYETWQLSNFSIFNHIPWNPCLVAICILSLNGVICNQAFTFIPSHFGLHQHSYHFNSFWLSLFALAFTRVCPSTSFLVGSHSKRTLSYFYFLTFRLWMSPVCGKNPSRYNRIASFILT